MKFNKLIAAGTILAVNLVNLPHAFAANTITFNGNITDATCDVSLEYKGAAVGTAGTGTIALDEVSKTALACANSSAGQVPFFIVAENCTLGTPAKTKVAANFKSANGDNQGYLNNTASTDAATNVQFRLLDSNRSTIKVNDPGQSTTSQFTAIDTEAGGKTRMPYFVEYVSAAGSATAGSVVSTVDYELMYQ